MKWTWLFGYLVLVVFAGTGIWFLLRGERMLGGILVGMVVLAFFAIRGQQGPAQRSLEAFERARHRLEFTPVDFSMLPDGLKDSPLMQRAGKYSCAWTSPRAEGRFMGFATVDTRRSTGLGPHRYFFVTSSKASESHELFFTAELSAISMEIGTLGWTVGESGAYRIASPKGAARSTVDSATESVFLSLSPVSAQGRPPAGVALELCNGWRILWIDNRPELRPEIFDAAAAAFGM